MLRQARLRVLLLYDPTDGLFRWRCDRRGGRGIKAGSVAGCVRKSDGRRRITIDGRTYDASRLAWLYLYGEWPSLDVEHRDMNPSNDRIANLRLATRSQNNGNVGPRRRNKSGHKGVHWSPERNKWVAMIQFEGKHKNLGRFDDIADAVSAYRDAATILFGEFARVS